MKPQVGNDRDGYFIVFHPESKLDYYHLGRMAHNMTHKMVWANEGGDDGDFKPIQMKVYIKFLMEYLTHSERTDT